MSTSLPEGDRSSMESSSSLPVQADAPSSSQPTEQQSVGKAPDADEDTGNSPTTSTNSGSMAADVEDELTEQQLRELYDNEEIDRFLHLFSAYVTEVRLPGGTDLTKSRPGSPTKSPTKSRTGSAHTTDENPADDDPDDWVDLDGFPHESPSVSQWPDSHTLSEKIAFNYVVPILPPEPMMPAQFTLGRLRLTMQRFYLAVGPAYGPFFSHLVDLATWKDQKTSLAYCAAFWIMWYQNLLLPALFLRIFFSLIRRKVLPYPTVAQLRERRAEVRRANDFGEKMQARLSASSAFGVREMWRIFRVFNKPKKTKAKNKAKNKAKDKGIIPDDGERKDTDGDTAGLDDVDSTTVLDDPNDITEEKDIKREILHAISEVTDLHERVKNIFIWRRPASSRMYGTVIFFLFLVTLFLPAKYIAKLAYAVGGIFFWHITPVIAALPPSERAKFPPAFADAPTDADYAMEVISQRVALGLDVVPPKPMKRNKKGSGGPSGNPSAMLSTDSFSSASSQQPEIKDKNVDWKKWGERAAIGKNWADDGKRLFTGQRPLNIGWPPQSPVVPQPVLAVGTSSASVETHTFPAQHTSGPGLITITPTTFYFTPLMAQHAKVTIPFPELLGVKKTGMLKGLSLRWAETLGDGLRGDEIQEKFMWVGGRDELFARLIGSDGKRWMRA
ncbi:hypothetical protein PLICRDRAFT_172032 [Plicaturopsis crispa FD-325 SS-3]|nr:hypothetical protein PLICRDRAFT_172032 [Plicaturopsis crispa FD-325 SS-3]